MDFDHVFLGLLLESTLYSQYLHFKHGLYSVFFGLYLASTLYSHQLHFKHGLSYFVYWNFYLHSFTINMEECYDRFKLSKTLKTHIISDHLADYFSATGKTLLTLKHKKQHISIVHWNSQNLK